MIPQLWADVKYHVPTGFGFSPKASGFYPFGDATALTGEGGGIAQRLFFMFLFFIPFTIRQQSIIYPHIFFTDPGDVCVVVWKNGRHFRLGEMPPLLIFKSRFWGLSVGWCACYFATFTAVPLERRRM